MKRHIYFILLTFLTLSVTRILCASEEGSGGDGWTESIDFEGSGDEQSECFRHQQLIRKQHLFGAHIPQCTPDGRYVPVQCDTARHQCWCVDEHGKEKPDTIIPYGSRHRCFDQGNRHRFFTQPPDDREATDDSIFVETTREPFEGGYHGDVRLTDGPVEIATVHPPEQETSGPPLPNKQAQSTILTWLADRPILLGIIIGALVLLILILLLCILFLAYRMKKSGEGSYSLDEPKRALLYTSIKDKEFYA